MTSLQEPAVRGLRGGPTEFLVVRLGTGEDFTSRLREEFVASGARAGSIVSAIGSFAEIVYGEGFYHDNGSLDMRQVVRSGQPFETGALSGHLGFTDSGDPISHVHGLFAQPDGRIFGGHVFEAKVLLTIELTLALPSSVAWTMQPHNPEAHVPMSIPRKAFLPCSAS